MLRSPSGMLLEATDASTERFAVQSAGSLSKTTPWASSAARLARRRSFWDKLLMRCFFGGKDHLIPDHGVIELFVLHHVIFQVSADNLL